MELHRVCTNDCTIARAVNTDSNAKISVTPELKVSHVLREQHNSAHSHSVGAIADTIEQIRQTKAQMAAVRIHPACPAPYSRGTIEERIGNRSQYCTRALSVSALSCLPKAACAEWHVDSAILRWANEWL